MDGRGTGPAGGVLAVALAATARELDGLHHVPLLLQLDEKHAVTRVSSEGGFDGLEVLVVDKQSWLCRHGRVAEKRAERSSTWKCKSSTIALRPTWIAGRGGSAEGSSG